MLKKITKPLILGLMIIIVLGLAACGGKNPYNAVMYGDVYEIRTWLQDDFYEENLTYGSWSSIIEGYVDDQSYPQHRTKIILDKNELDTVFKEFPVEVDFEKEMIIMHCFTTASSGKYEIKSISVEEQTLIVRYKHPASKGKTPPNASMPLTKWVIVSMDKLDIKTVEFVFGK